MRRTYRYPIRFSETDALGHVNNTVYFVYFEAARSELFRIFVPDMNTAQWKIIVASSHCDFKSEARFGQTMVVSTFIQKIGTSSFTVGHEIHDEDTGTLIAQGSAVLVHYDFTSKKALPLTAEHRAQLLDWME